MSANLRQLIAAYQICRGQRADMVLATVIEADGSTYRKPGARMLVSRDLPPAGGPLDPATQEIIDRDALAVLASRQTRTCTYDARRGSGTDWNADQDQNGMIRVLFEYLAHDKDTQALEFMNRAVVKREPATLVTICESSIVDLPPGSNFLYSGSGECRHADNEIYTGNFAPVAAEVAQSGACLLHTSISDTGNCEAFIDCISPPLHLLLVGAREDAIPVLTLAGALGWEISVVDCGNLNSAVDRQQLPIRVLTPRGRGLLHDVDCAGVDAAVLMTHSFSTDRLALAELADTQIPYIGVLGPAAKREKLLETLAGSVPGLPQRVHGPAGLDIGAETAAAVAISIIAEIHAVLHGRPGGSLSVIPGTDTEQPAPDTGKLYALILAAGGSSRFGGIKQLVELSGKSLLQRAVETASGVFNDRVVVVLGLKAVKLRRELSAFDVTITINDHWQEGMATSLQTGLEALPEDCSGVLVLFCDQPLINGRHLQQLIETWSRRPERIVASSYADTIGVPVIFPRRYFTEFGTIKGDKGAKSVLLRHRESVTEIAIPEAAFDVDTQSDLIEFLGGRIHY